ncbi:MAG: electron transfer flavoprotein subunit beta/FixA family protein [Deltaproteobacteria bacterium]|nr:electron transfer flavoprotein subunit beta/FixA family protein [Deltaproteobacteria bacterium]
MKILVTAKRVPDPEQKVKIKGDAVDLAGANFVVNPFDEYAVETALRLTEKGSGGERSGEVVVLSIGPKDASQQVRSCLAMGADRGILVAGDDTALDSEQVARIVTAVVQKEKPTLVLMGKQTVDGDANQVPQLVAGYLGLPQACFACDVELASDQASVTVGREVDGGTEFKKLPLPAVVSVDLRIVMPNAVRNAQGGATYGDGPRYASLKGIMAAKKKTIEELDAAALGVSLTPAVKTVGVEAPPERKAGIKVESVDQLIEKLRTEAKVL